VTRKRYVFVPTAIASIASALLWACATGSTASPPSGASGEGGLLESDGAGGGTDSAPADAGADSAPIVCSGDSGPDLDGSAINGCPQSVDGGPAVWVDRTCATEWTFNWNLGTTPTDPNRCMKLKAGSSVTWIANPSFNTHPLEPDGGDTPSPFDALDAGGSKTLRITFPEAGVYGFQCHNHSGMTGAVQVLP
jgi:hypothetical protein